MASNKIFQITGITFLLVKKYDVNICDKFKKPYNGVLM